MDDLVRKTKDIIAREKLIGKGERVLVGCSGGADSVTLLFVLREIGHELSFDLGVAHVNHLLRGEESDRDENFVRGLADRFSIPCYVKRVDVKEQARNSGKSLQHAGRDIRYEFFHDISGQLGFTRIAVAHTLDDQVETFVLRLVKGTGIRGLSSIPMVRGKIIRPFLTTYRSAIEAYAHTRAITFVEDASNKKSVYERNFVRREIMPAMEKLNPAVKNKIIALLGDLTMINAHFDRKASEFLGSERTDTEEGVLVSLERLKGLSEEVRYRVLSILLQELEPSFLPLREHIRLVEKVLAGSKPNLSAQLPRGVRVKKTYDQVTFTKKAEAVAVTEVFPVQAGSNRIAPLNLTLDVAEIDEHSNEIPIAPTIAYLDKEKLGDLRVRTFMPGDRFVPLGMKRPVKVKDFFMGQKIPKDRRSHIPLLLSGAEIVWVVGNRIDERYKVTRDTRSVLRITAVFEGNTP